MIKNQYILNKTEEYFNRKARKSASLAFFNEQMLLADEEYSKIKYELKGAIFDAQKAKYLNKNDEFTLLQEKINNLSEKKQILTEKILSGQQSNVFFECQNCLDSGKTINGDFCTCFYKELSNQALNFMGIKKHSLKSFDQDTYSKENGNDKLFDKMKSYAENFNDASRSLLFIGSPGTGKTFLAQAISSAVESKNNDVIYLTSTEFNQALLNYHLAPIYDKQIYSDIFNSTNLLVIDDLGTEPIYKNVTLELILSVISERLANKKPTIITTNLDQKTLLSRYGERLYSRLSGKEFIKISFSGKDLRKI